MINLILRIYYLLFSFLYKKLNFRRGTNLALDVILFLFFSKNYRYKIKIDEDIYFKGNLKNSRYRNLYFYRSHESIETELLKKLTKKNL